MKMIDQPDVKNNGVNMAWNEPGGSGDDDKAKKDPWGSNGGDKNKGSSDQGPPDLDEIVKQMQGKVTKLFGGKGGGGGGGSGASGEGPSNTLIGLLAGVLFVFWAASGIYIIDPAERGVVLQFGSYSSTSLPGPHWRIPYPVETVEIVDVDQIRNVEVGYRSSAGRAQGSSVPQESLMLTQDENIVDIKFAVQYRVKEAQNYLFNVRDPDATLRQATESAIREAIGKSKMDFVLTQGQSDIANRTKELIQEILDRYVTGLEVTSVNLQSAQPPQEVKSAFEDAIRAREDKQRFINEADAYSNDIIPKARGGGARQLEEAAGYKARVIAQAEGESKRFLSILNEYEKSPEVTRERLYVDMMQSVMSNTSKVMVDVEGGSNLLYLPLDKLMGQSQNINLSQIPQVMAPNLSQPTLAPQSNERRLRDNLRSRGER
ncbi:MAG: FtsH protease activity modulator HflK [Gammaproteobacteria bacterium]|nr:FtsH protease activity modulator HflK [Gammaproteobacteria bacterium]